VLSSFLKGDDEERLVSIISCVVVSARVDMLLVDFLYGMLLSSRYAHPADKTFMA